MQIIIPTIIQGGNACFQGYINCSGCFIISHFIMKPVNNLLDIVHLQLPRLSVSHNWNRCLQVRHSITADPFGVTLKTIGPDNYPVHVGQDIARAYEISRNEALDTHFINKKKKGNSAPLNSCIYNVYTTKRLTCLFCLDKLKEEQPEKSSQARI